MKTSAIASAFAAVLRDQDDDQLAELLRALPDERLAELAAEAFERKQKNGASAPARPQNGGSGNDVEKVYAQIAQAKQGIGRREIQKRTGLPDSMIGHLLRKLVRSGQIRLEGSRTSARWFTTGKACEA
jgi:DNA invertase Pin-like site-specific DNA recombinase